MFETSLTKILIWAFFYCQCLTKLKLAALCILLLIKVEFDKNVIIVYTLFRLWFIHSLFFEKSKLFKVLKWSIYNY